MSLAFSRQSLAPSVHVLILIDPLATLNGIPFSSQGLLVAAVADVL